MNERQALRFWQIAFGFSVFFLIVAVSLLTYTRQVFLEIAGDANKCFQDQRQLIRESRDTERALMVCSGQLQTCERASPSSFPH